MNSGKICISVSAESAAELAGLLSRAEALADVVELRFDGLDAEGIRNAFEQLSSTKQILVTMRPKEQGGRSDRSLTDRIGFWTEYAIHRSIDHPSIWIDHEYDLRDSKDFMFWVDQCFVIRSKHYFEGQAADLQKAYDATVSDEEVGKIAVSTRNVTDAIEIWKLLLKANAEGKRLIPIAMGEAGKWTRILGPAHGAFMTYAALDAGAETAAGQLTAKDLTETFRVRELDRSTKVYGVLAGNTSYSISPWMQNAAFKAAGLNSVFVPLQTSDLGEFMSRMVFNGTREIDLNFAGFSVTNPHKVRIMEFLDEIEDSARVIGAVNTVKIENGRLLGYNTDAYGFISTLEETYGSLSGARVAVFGAGGAARACVYVLSVRSAGVTVFARNEAAGGSLADEFDAAYERSASSRKIGEEFDIVVNTTPLGTIGSNEKFAVLEAEQLKGLKLVYDLVYNPIETELMLEAKLASVPSISGMEMLIAQGVKQFEIWTGIQAPENEMRTAVMKRLVI